MIFWVYKLAKVSHACIVLTRSNMSKTLSTRLEWAIYGVQVEANPALLTILDLVSAK